MKAHRICTYLVVPRSRSSVKIRYQVKVARQILGRKFYKNTNKSSLYSQSLLIFIHRTPVVERHPIKREIRDLLRPMWTLRGNMVYLYMSSIYILKIYRRSFKHMMKILWKNHCMFVILWNLSVISHWIFPQYFFFLFLAPNLKIT